MCVKSEDSRISFVSEGRNAIQHYAGIKQLQKALYWVEKPNADINGISFGNLISCLEELLLDETSAREM